MIRIVLAFAVLAIVALPARADDAGLCVQRGLASQGFDPGPMDGTLHARHAGAAEGFASANPRHGLAELNDVTDDEWCSVLLGLAAAPAVAEAIAWLDRAAAAADPALRDPVVGLPLGTHAANARQLLEGAELPTLFRGNPVATIRFTYAVHCPSSPAVHAQVRHERPDERHIVAVVHVCSPFLGTPISTRIQTIIHELYHALNGPGECNAMWFEYWTAYLATGRFAMTTYWTDSGCNNAQLRGLPL